MSTTNTLRIWSHVRQLGPLSGDIAGDAWFSINLAPIFVSDSTAKTDVDVNLATRYLQPWTWQWTQSRLRMALIRGGAVIGLIDIPAASIVGESPTASVSNAFADEFAQTTATFDPVCFTEPLAGIHSSVAMNENTPRDWRTYLLHASTYPGNIPLRAGIAVFFHIPYAQLNNADEIVVAPVFANAPFSAQLAPVDPPLSTAMPPLPCSNLVNPMQPASPCAMFRLKSDLSAYAPGATPWVTQWNYASPTGTDLNVQWIQTQAPLRIPGAAGVTPWGNDGFIDEQTLWIQPSADSWKQDVNWHEQLEQRVASFFDLPSRLLEWADQSLYNHDPSGIDSNFGQALLALIRDGMRACGDGGAQILDRPDGGTLAADIAAVIAPGVANALARSQILTKVQTYYSGFDTYSNWKVRVTDALTASGRFALDSTSAWENPIQTNGNYNDWLKLMHGVMAWLFDPDNLRVFIEADFAKALNDPTLGGALAGVDQYLRNIDLLSVLRQGFMGVAWGKQQGAWYAKGNFAASMTTALIDVYRDRLGLPDPPPPAGQPARTPWAYKSLLPREDAVTKNQQSSIEAYLSDFISNWDRSQKGTAPVAGTTPDFSRGNQGINIQFSNNDTFAGDDQAFLGNFRGAAVLMRPSSKDAQGNPLFNWTMLHLGQYSLRGDGTDPNKPSGPPLNKEQVVIAPTQIVYRNGLRQVATTYRNQPVSARSPAAGLSQVRSVKGYADSDYRQGIFQLWSPYGGDSPFRLPRLVFGMTYDVAATAVGIAGEMAKEIADPQKPWMVSTNPAAWNPPADKIHTTDPYLRTIPVGLVRVEGQKSRAYTPISTMTGPPIPDMVFPMIRSLKPIDSQQDTVILLADTQNVAQITPAGSWIAGAVNSMQLFIRPPAVDLATFDNWPISPVPSVSDRAAIYSLIAQNTDIPNNGDSSQSPDLTLDDPSVTSFSFTLTQVVMPGAPQPPPITGAFPVCRTPTGSSTLLQQYQSVHVSVSIVVGKSSTLQTPNTCTDPQQVLVTVPPGTIFQLDITPVVGNSALFATGALKPAPRTFFIEVATALNVPSLNDAAAALNSSLKLSLSSPSVTVGGNSGNDQLQIGLDLNALAAALPQPNLALQIHRVELMVQRWRWQGRPLARFDSLQNPMFDFPYTDLKPPGTNADSVLAPLDGIYFGERDSNDQLIVGGQVDLIADAVAAAAAAAATPPGLPPAAPVLYTYDLSQSPQGLYYRFAVRVFSRYEGLFTKGASVESRILRSTSSQVAADAAPEQWRRLLPLCRRTATAPKPSVRLIIPVTRAVNGEQTPGLMVVINEPWYEWAGLAEQFQVQIASVTDPTSGNSYLQAGPDPVVSNPDYGAQGATPPLKLEPNPLAAGPIGFTFDTNTNAPLFSTTSFLVPAPRMQNADGTLTAIELSWWFLELQFRRTVHPAGTANYAPALDSDWTVPMQAQLLPAANLWNVTVNGTAGRMDASELQAFSSGSPGISILDSSGNSVVVNSLPFDSTSTNRFEVWAMLTVNLQDAFGHAGQESFVTMVPIASLATLPPTGATTLRLIEVQAMSPASPTRTDWRLLADDLFSPANNSDNKTDPAMARARIVRVSPPISVFE